VIEHGLTTLEPREMSAHARHDPHAALGDVTPQLRPERPGTRGPKDVPGSPGIAGRTIRIFRQRLPFAGQTRELPRFLQLANPSLDPDRPATEP
jgi:hypothetical protein